MKKLILILTFIFLVSGCDELKVKSQLNDKELEISELKTQNVQLTKEVKELTAQVARFSAGQPAGDVIEEQRKALAHKETQLILRERRYESNIEALNLKEKGIAEMQAQFYTETGEQFIEVGEAQQIKQDYEEMKNKLMDAEKSASNWLKLILFLVVCFIAAIISLMFTGIRYAVQRREVEHAMQFIQNGNFSQADKGLLTSYFNKGA